VVAFGILAAVAVAALFPGLAGEALAQDILLGDSPAGTPGHLLGTDELGRDVLRLTVAGARSALVGPLVIAAGSMVLGLVLGLLAGQAGGWIDWLISRYTDLTLALPSLLLAIVAAGVIGGGYWVSVGVLIVLYSPYDIRLIRSGVLQQVHQPYIEATRVLGLGRARVLFGHILPNVRGLMFANLFLNVAFALVSLSALSYLGLGVSPQEADWGRQLSDARDILWTNPAASLVPALAIVATAMAINLVGDWLAERTGVGDE
jgi:peptide/nickel transport system permease protein